MLDLLFLALMLIFFAATVGFVIVCQRLMEDA